MADTQGNGSGPSERPSFLSFLKKGKGKQKREAEEGEGRGGGGGSSTSGNKTNNCECADVTFFCFMLAYPESILASWPVVSSFSIYPLSHHLAQSHFFIPNPGRGAFGQWSQGSHDLSWD
jgi:hypothetical protein